MIIGLTGSSGTGKSNIAQLTGFYVIDVDKIYHEILEKDEDLRYELSKTFNTCNRKELADIVFENVEELNKLNTITAKYLIKAVEEKIQSANTDIIIDAAVLFELGLHEKCHTTFAVIVDYETKINRIIKRDNLSPKQAKARINAQKPDDFYSKSADYIIHNNGCVTAAVQTLKKRLQPKRGIYGGTFDPPTLGHLDVIRRAATLFDELYVVALVNEEKKPIFTLDERVSMLEKITEDIPNVYVDRYNGLLAKYAYKKDARYSVRGIRNGFDAEYERPMFEFNTQIAQEEYGFKLDTVFIPTTRENSDTSSSNVCRLLSGKVYNVAKKYLDERIAPQIIKKYQSN
jgi:pantetheine-phosphate adenylyltransferase